MIKTEWLSTVKKCTQHKNHACYIDSNNKHYVLVTRSRGLPAQKLQQQLLLHQQLARLGMAAAVVASGTDWYVYQHRRGGVSMCQMLKKTRGVDARLQLAKQTKLRLKRLRDKLETNRICPDMVSIDTVELYPDTRKIYITNFAMGMQRCDARKKLLHKTAPYISTIQ